MSRVDPLDGQWNTNRTQQWQRSDMNPGGNYDEKAATSLSSLPIDAKVRLTIPTMGCVACVNKVDTFHPTMHLGCQQYKRRKIMVVRRRGKRWCGRIDGIGQDERRNRWSRRRGDCRCTWCWVCMQSGEFRSAWKMITNACLSTCQIIMKYVWKHTLLLRFLSLPKFQCLIEPTSNNSASWSIQNINPHDLSLITS